MSYWFGYPDRAINTLLYGSGFVFVGSYILAKFLGPLPILKITIISAVIIPVVVTAIVLGIASYQAIKGYLDRSDSN
jgi:Na+/H+-dicarboxylate symporter